MSEAAETAPGRALAAEASPSQPRVARDTIELAIGMAMIVAVAAIAPMLPAYYKGVCIQMMIMAIFALGINVLTGYCGLSTMGHAAHFGIGSYAAGLLTRLTDLGFVPILALSLLVSAAAGLFLSAFVLRTRGTQFLIVTLAFAEIVAGVALSFRQFTGGEDGLPDIARPAFLRDMGSFFYFALAVFAICHVATYVIARAPLGTAFQGIRESEPRMRALGYDTYAYKTYSENGLSRLIAGFSWPWISKNDRSLYDIEIDGSMLQWNSVSDDFINSANALNEVGCIHTTQGYDLNYAGVIFGNEITYDKVKNEIVILKENYFDRNGKQSISDPSELKDFIINIYKTIMLRGIKGTYVYVCDKNLGEYFANFINKFRMEKTVKYLPKEKIIQFENAIPVFDLKAAAGAFSELQIVNVDDYDWIELPPRYKSSKELFACTVLGESMNKVIPNGSICLFRRYTGGSRNGKIVLVELANIQDPDFGSGYTVKEYWSKKNIDSDQWSHESIILKPLSDDSGYSDIVITEDELSYLKVVAIFECVL